MSSCWWQPILPLPRNERFKTIPRTFCCCLFVCFVFNLDKVRVFFIRQMKCVVRKILLKEISHNIRSFSTRKCIYINSFLLLFLPIISFNICRANFNQLPIHQIFPFLIVTHYLLLAGHIIIWNRNLYSALPLLYNQVWPWH